MEDKDNNEIINIPGVLKTPWEWINRELIVFSWYILGLIDDIFLSKREDYNFLENIKKIEENLYAKLPFLKDISNIVNKEIEFIIAVYNDCSYSSVSEDFIRAYEWYIVLREINEIIISKGVTVDYQKVQSIFLTALRNEPNRKDIFWLLLYSISKSYTICCKNSI